MPCNIIPQRTAAMQHGAGHRTLDSDAPPTKSLTTQSTHRRRHIPETGHQLISSRRLTTARRYSPPSPHPISPSPHPMIPISDPGLVLALRNSIGRSRVIPPIPTMRSEESTAINPEFVQGSSKSPYSRPHTTVRHYARTNTLDEVAADTASESGTAVEFGSSLGVIEEDEEEGADESPNYESPILEVPRPSAALSMHRNVLMEWVALQAKPAIPAIPGQMKKNLRFEPLLEGLREEDEWDEEEEENGHEEKGHEEEEGEEDAQEFIGITVTPPSDDEGSEMDGGEYEYLPSLEIQLEEDSAQSSFDGESHFFDDTSTSYSFTTSTTSCDEDDGFDEDEEEDEACETKDARLLKEAWWGDSEFPSSVPSSSESPSFSKDLSFTKDLSAAVNAQLDAIEKQIPSRRPPTQSSPFAFSHLFYTFIGGACGWERCESDSGPYVRIDQDRVLRVPAQSLQSFSSLYFEKMRGGHQCGEACDKWFNMRVIM